MKFKLFEMKMRSARSFHNKIIEIVMVSIFKCLISFSITRHYANRTKLQRRVVVVNLKE